MALAFLNSLFAGFRNRQFQERGYRTLHLPGILESVSRGPDLENMPEVWVESTSLGVSDFPNLGANPADVSKDTPFIGLQHLPHGSVAQAEWDGAYKVVSDKPQFSRGEFLLGEL